MIISVSEYDKTYNSVIIENVLFDFGGINPCHKVFHGSTIKHNLLGDCSFMTSRKYAFIVFYTSSQKRQDHKQLLPPPGHGLVL